jgi:hypothetical protein
MSDPEGDDEWIKDRIAFEARFPLEAFEPIAQALGKSAEPKSLEELRGWLLPYFDLFLSGTGIEPSREERKKSLVELRDAARTLLKSVLLKSVGIGGLGLDLTWGLVKAARDQQFKATVQRLADEADTQIQKLSKLGRTGRPTKNAAFRELTPELIRIFEHLGNTEAKKPNWRGDSGMYGSTSAFYDFAVTVWRCLYLYLPEVRGALPASEAALAMELKNHWPKQQA